ncbi:MAG: hypothetical protein P0116_14600 [Candidatus Nitrosocosmicus sp.]|nr:hypothetical protein [Candidatus Nitrosocosmicus sp.]
MSSIVEVSGNKVNDNEVTNTLSMIFGENHISDCLKNAKIYYQGVEKVKNKKYA